MYTLLRGRNLIKQHLGRTPDDDSIDSAQLNDAFNRWRRECWRDAGGPQGDTLRLAMTVGLRDYRVDVPGGTAGIVGASIRYGTTPSTGTTPLRRASIRDLRRWVPNYPNDEAPLGRPRYFMVRPMGLAWPTGDDDPDETPAAGGPGLVISLYPVPDTTVDGGLIVEASGQAAALLSDADVSPLPDVADECAAIHAAYEMYSFRSREPGAAETLGFLRDLRTEMLQRLRDYLLEVDGGITDFAPELGYGPTLDRRGPWGYGFEWPGDYAGTTAPAPEIVKNGQWAAITITPGEGATRYTWETSAAPVDMEQIAALTVQSTLGQIFDVSVAPGGVSVTAILDAGLTFAASDVAVLRYIRRTS